VKPRPLLNSEPLKAAQGGKDSLHFHVRHHKYSVTQDGTRACVGSEGVVLCSGSGGSSEGGGGGGSVVEEVKGKSDNKIRPCLSVCFCDSVRCTRRLNSKLETWASAPMMTASAGSIEKWGGRGVETRNRGGAPSCKIRCTTKHQSIIGPASVRRSLPLDPHNTPPLFTALTNLRNYPH
jgi:hypothetical protein